ncbi:MAG TPA: SLBB domain-containing protein, partial [Paraburkholderia sp.]
HDGEILNVTSAVNLIVGHVTLMGNVREPGDYAVDKVRTLHDLLPSAEAFLPLTYTPFAFVMREDKGTLQRHVIPFSIRQLIEGKFNIDLQSDDVVHVLTFASMRQLLALSVAAENAEGATFAGPDASTAAAAGQVAQCVSAQERLQSLPSPDRARSLSAMARRACQPSQAAPATAPNLLQSLTSVGQQTATAGNQTSANGQQTSVTAPAAGQPGLASATTASASSANAPATSSGETSGADAANATGVDAATVAGLTADEQASVGFVLGDYRVTLEGGIREVGDYLAAPGVSLEEMVDAANGLMPDADLNAVEITSVSIDNVEGRSTASRKLYALTPEKLASVPLNRLDVVQIPRVPSNQEQGSVIIDGEVQFPGTYHILKGERLSSLLQRAGGLTRDAYPFGAVFQRPSVARVQQSAHDREADDLQKQLVASVAQNGGPLGGSSGSAFGLTPEATNFLEDVIGQLRDKRVDGRISIVADPVALAADPEADIEVQPGDKLFVPKHPSEVIVTGEVLNPGSYRFSPKLGATDYISMSGGYDRYADEDHMFVINPDGTSHSVSDGMFSISDDRMAPGSVVVVPRDLKPLDLGTLTVMVSKVLSDFAISAASLAVVVHNNN